MLKKGREIGPFFKLILENNVRTVGVVRGRRPEAVPQVFG
jgi:hypothetical protein